MKKMNLLFGFFLLTVLSANARIWRVNNNAGVTADATTVVALFDGVTSLPGNPEAANGDTIHVEPSATNYAFPVINKQVVIIGNGYFLSGTGSNSGLQANTSQSRIQGFRFSAGSAGTKIIGIELTSSCDFGPGYSGAVNIEFEKSRFTVSPLFTFAAGVTYSGITIKKCLLAGINNSIPATTTINNFFFENNIVSGNIFWFKATLGSNIVLRNNTFKLAGSNPSVDLNNAYVANNVFLTANFSNSFISCNVKNNLFTNAQAGVVVGPLNVNGNNLISQTEASIITNTGSDDGKFQLAAGSPAINGGVDISGVKPSCGAFGGNDPYKLSGIPGIPTIYTLTVPASVPLATSTMNVTFSTRNNN